MSKEGLQSWGGASGGSGKGEGPGVAEGGKGGSKQETAAAGNCWLKPRGCQKKGRRALGKMQAPRVGAGAKEELIRDSGEGGKGGGMGTTGGGQGG